MTEYRAPRPPGFEETAVAVALGVGVGLVTFYVARALLSATTVPDRPRRDGEPREPALPGSEPERRLAPPPESDGGRA